VDSREEGGTPRPSIRGTSLLSRLKTLVSRGKYIEGRGTLEGGERDLPFSQKEGKIKDEPVGI